MSFANAKPAISPVQSTTGSLQSELTHWPIQLHLITPAAGHFVKSDLLVAATGFFGDFTAILFNFKLYWANI